MSAEKRDWRRFVLIAYGLAIFAIVASSGQPGDPEWWPLAIGYVVFASVPIGVLCVGPSQVGLKTLGAAAMAVSGIWAYFDATHDPGAGSTAALMFVILPFYQILAAVAFLILLWLVRRWGGDEGESE
ncbi:hypothetical protein [Parerythrobacter aestuarii]|uniref:hypothetical protein n=1 Tax=Parerythrobacter aestuarii TaxID=3020909 RepID=UPI0024DE3A5A|nr:hypothetical protein [Parerythrobacter aestuarii]